MLAPRQFERLIETTVRALEIFEGRVVWNINSTARGGGVAEMLQSLLAYARGADVDARWAVISGNPDFFRVTKRIHNHLHGSAGDGGDLGDEERAIYERVIERNAQEMLDLVGPKDVVLVHDPQPAGMISALTEKVDLVIWRCHVGLDMPNELARRAWDFLMPYVQPARSYVFSRKAFVWEDLDRDRGGLAQLAFGTNLASDPGYLGNEAIELVHHRVDRVLEIQHLAAHIRRDLLAEVSAGDRTDDTLHLAGGAHERVDKVVHGLDASRPTM